MTGNCNANGETGAQQAEVKAVGMSEFKSDIVEQLHSPLGVMGLLTLSINPPHPTVSSKALLTLALTTAIYHSGSNNISTRKLSDSVLRGLAMVEFIKSCTQVSKMISADGGGIQPWGWGQRRPLHSQELVHGMQSLVLSASLDVSRPSAASSG